MCLWKHEVQFTVSLTAFHFKLPPDKKFSQSPHLLMPLRRKNLLGSFLLIFRKTTSCWRSNFTMRSWIFFFCFSKEKKRRNIETVDIRGSSLLSPYSCQTVQFLASCAPPQPPLCLLLTPFLSNEHAVPPQRHRWCRHWRSEKTHPTNRQAHMHSHIKHLKRHTPRHFLFLQYRFCNTNFFSSMKSDLNLALC